MKKSDLRRKETFSSGRRRLIQGLALGAAARLLDRGAGSASAEIAPPEPATLTGTQFDLTIATIPVNFSGRISFATAVNGTVPGPLLRWREGDDVTVRVTNRLKVPTSIHWHAIRLPSGMDGVPGLSFPGIAPGETFVYRFPVLQSGTYWYHSHTRFQEQTGLAGPLVIDRSAEPRGDRRGIDPVQSDREYVVFLSDWTDTNPETLFQNLKGQSDYYNYHRLTLPGFIAEARRSGWRKTAAERLQWARMDMSPTDIADVTGATYTYLLNGRTPGANWTGTYKAGERIRLRFINGSSMTFFDVRIPGLRMQVVQADGNDIEPVTVDEFRMGVAETYDVIVQPETSAAYTIFAQAEDRSGYARGTLAPNAGMDAPVPAMDPRPVLTLMDMGMKMAGKANHQMNMSGSKGMEEGCNSQGPTPQNAVSLPVERPNGRSTPAFSVSAVPAGGRMPFPQPGPGDTPIPFQSGIELQSVKLVTTVFSPPQIGPQVDNVAACVTERLNDPGAGLAGNGRRVLTYADLRARYRGVDRRPPVRELELHLSGNMERYIWGFNGQRFAGAEPIELKLGERLRVVLINDTMMAHPIHLHGLWSELENGQGEFNPYKHTIVAKPAERVNYLVSADTPGRWAYHCHLLYHMEAGMFRIVVVS